MIVMRVTKPKKAKKSLNGNGGRNSAVLPSDLRKKLDKSGKSGLVFFDEADQGDWRELSNECEVAIAGKDTTKSFNIRLAESSLDVYRSPHVIDLSRRNRYHESMLFKAPAEVKYEDLPGGEFLAKYRILDFWDWDKSEIIIACKHYYAGIKFFYHQVFDQPEINPLQESAKKAGAGRKSSLEEAFLISLSRSISDFFYRIYLYFHRTILVSRLLARQAAAKDETIWLERGKSTVSNRAKEALNKLIAGSAEPSISELLKPHLEKKEFQDGKFKIINYSPTRKREIQEKYLADNFTRKGVVVTPQKPSKSWPKDSLSWDLGNLAFSPATLKPAAAVLGILIALIGSVQLISYWDQIKSIKGQVMGEAETALSSIDSASGDLKSMDFDSARDKFASANGNFVSAQNRLAEIKSFITALAEIAPAENTFKSGTNIIDMGEHLSYAAAKMLDAITAATDGGDLSLSSRIKNFSLSLSPILTELEAASANAQNIGLNNLSDEQKDKLIRLKAALPEAISGLQSLMGSSAFAVKVLGDNDVRRYLLVFQNDNELRATGGFMGSFALVDLRGGKIDKISIPEGGTYDVRAGLNQAVAPPEPMRLVANRWEFQDSNWWPDFPSSAKNIKWFYEKSGGPTVDGVIAVNSEFLGKLLAVTGPIDLPDYGKVITAENFETELQKSIELEAKEKTKPKKILAELAPILMEKLLLSDPKEIFNLAQSLGAGLRERDIQLYFSDGELQKFAAAKNWTGGLSSLSGSDYLSVNSTNLGGGKTDGVIKQKIYHTAEIQADGSIIDKVLIERRNIGPIDDFFTTWTNNSYIRVYVPQGSELLSARGFGGIKESDFKPVLEGLSAKEELLMENSAQTDPLSGTKVYDESGKTVFANWTRNAPGESRELLLVYRLPFKISFKSGDKSIVEKAADYFTPETAVYGLKFQKQSGRSNDEIMSEVAYPDNLQLKLSYPQSIAAESNKLLLSDKTDTDKFLIAGFIRN